MRQYKFVALFVFVLFLPVTAIGIANAAKPTKPEYALQSDLAIVAHDVATLDAEVVGLSAQVTQNTADIENIRANPSTLPQPVIVDSTGTVVAILLDLDLYSNYGTRALLKVGQQYALMNVSISNSGVGDLRGTTTIWFDNVECTGNAYRDVGGPAYGTIRYGRVYAADQAVEVSVAIFSMLDSAECRAQSGNDRTVMPMTDLGSAPNWVPPFVATVR